MNSFVVICQKWLCFCNTGLNLNIIKGSMKKNRLFKNDQEHTIVLNSVCIQGLYEVYWDVVKSVCGICCGSFLL